MRNSATKSVSGPMSNGGACAELAAPQLDGAHVLKVLIQHVRNHAKHVRQFTVCDLILEVADVDRGEVLLTLHRLPILAPISGARPGWSSLIDHAVGERDIDQFSSVCCEGHFGVGERVWVARAVDLVRLDALFFSRGCLHPNTSSPVRMPCRLLTFQELSSFRVGT